MLEYYKYDLYGKPTYWSASGSQLPASSYNVADLFTGQRWLPQLGLYDDRNRFMSPDLGRFLQPDPIGFKGDGSNLYRYCGNDWANRSDPTGLFGDRTADRAHMEDELKDQNRMDASQREAQWALRDCTYAPTAVTVERQTQRQLAQQAKANSEGGLTYGPIDKVANGAPKLDPSRVDRAAELFHKADSKSDDMYKYSYTQLKDGRVVEGISTQAASGQWKEQTDPKIRGVPTENGHVHPEGKIWAPFSRLDKGMGLSAYVVKNHDKSDTQHPGAADLYYRGWEYRLNKSNNVIDSFPNPY